MNLFILLLRMIRLLVQYTLKRMTCLDKKAGKGLKGLLNDKTFLDLGKKGIPGPGHKKIRCHFVYDVKHDGRHKARLVAGGHLTEIPIDSIYSSEVSLKGLRLVTFITELTGLETWSTDVGNA